MEKGICSAEYLDFVKKKGVKNLTRNQWQFTEFLLRNRRELIKMGDFASLFYKVRKYLKEDYDWNNDKQGVTDVVGQVGILDYPQEEGDSEDYLPQEKVVTNEAYRSGEVHGTDI